ncbi:MAG TPA: NTP transferase domain-containing protein [Armatimonadota bacterium]|jgi:bifunctional UDP-N-acetylglucosamine pyrophosphorylase/glucosamine-1-phosphate N-acetyltransferase
MKLRAAVILAAGEGSRLWPFNEVRQKCAFPIAGVPLVRRLAEDLVRLGVGEVAVVVGPGEASVRHALHGLVPQPLIVRQPAGTTGSASAAVAGIGALPGEPEAVLILHGDLCTSPDNLRALVDAAEAADCQAAALVQPLGAERSGDWICAATSGGRLEGVWGHPRGGSQRLAGAYVFRQDAFAALRDNPGLVTGVEVGGMPPLEADLAASLQLLLDDGVEVLAVEATGFHVDVDRPWHLLEANARLLEHLSSQLEGDRIHPTARVDDSAEVKGRLMLGPGACVGRRCVVGGDLWLGAGASVTNGAILKGRAHLGPEAVVRDHALLGENGSLGRAALMGHGAEMDGVVLERAYLYHYCEISGVVGAAVDFGAATVCGTLRFDDANPAHLVKGRREVPPSDGGCSFFGDYSRTGVNSIIMPGVKVGIYSCVGPGVLLKEDLPNRTLVQVHQELETKPWGPDRYGW